MTQRTGKRDEHGRRQQLGSRPRRTIRYKPRLCHDAPILAGSLFMCLLKDAVTAHHVEKQLPGHTGAAAYERQAWRHLANYLFARGFALIDFHKRGR